MTAVDSRILVVVPLYNHGKSLRNVAVRALACGLPVLVVDDGSTDGGGETVADLPIQLMTLARNRGKGMAIRIAAGKARAMGMSHIITIDADGQHRPEDLPRFAELIARDPTALIVGRRKMRSADAPYLSRFGRRFSNFWFRLQTGTPLRDTQSGFRAYPLFALEMLKLWSRRYAFEVEILVKAAWAGLSIRELDVAVNYLPSGQRISHFHLIKDNLRLGILNTYLTVRSITPLPHRKIVFDANEGDPVSVLHPLRSLRGLMTENASPGRLSIAAGLGVLLGALPLIACHTMAILFASGFLRLNRAVALATSQLCMPPIVPALCVEAGYFLRNGSFLTEFSLNTIGYQAMDRLWEWLLGALVLGPVLSFLAGGITYLLARSVGRRSHG